MSRGYTVPTLHQQDGGLTMQAFADCEGLTLKQAMTAARRGQILGARQDSRSKRWYVYPPAKLTCRPRGYTKRSAAGMDVADCAGIEAERITPRAAPPSGAGVMAAASCSHADAYPMQAAARAAAPLPASQQAPQGRAGGCSSVYRSPETRSICQALREAAARQHREGIHYLRLDAHEFAQLYAALDNDRSRVRKLVGRGVLPVGLLRASDTVWQKMQAMSQQGRLL